MEYLRESAEKKDDNEEIEGVESPAEKTGGDGVERFLRSFGQINFLGMQLLETNFVLRPRRSQGLKPLIL
jgi:hypothetical protein